MGRIGCIAGRGDWNWGSDATGDATYGMLKKGSPTILCVITCVAR